MDDMQAVIDTAQQAVVATAVAAGLFYVPQRANGADAGFVSLEKYSLNPGRARGVIEVFEPESFNKVIADNPGGVVNIYVDRNATNPKITAILNDCGVALVGEDAVATSVTGWRDHRVVYTFRQTPQWLKWQAIDGKLLGQEVFAEFIEDNGADIQDPPAGVMLEIASSLEVKRDVAFRSAIKLNDGTVQFIHAQDDTAKSAGGVLTVPERMTIGLCPFQGLPAYMIPARFRYRLHDGKLLLGIKLQRVEDMMKDILNELVSKLQGGAIIEGSAPSFIVPY